MSEIQMPEDYNLIDMVKCTQWDPEEEISTELLVILSRKKNSDKNLLSILNIDDEEMKRIDLQIECQFVPIQMTVSPGEDYIAISYNFDQVDLWSVLELMCVAE